MKIIFIPIDNRPVCYSLPKDICNIDTNIELLLPPRNLLGDLKCNADIDSLLAWLKNIPKADAIILSLDTIAYGGLIPSRRSNDTFSVILERIKTLKTILETKSTKIYAFSSIMRISNNNFNEEEKEYWKDYGKKIFEYSFSGGKSNSGVPDDILDDYLTTRKRNFEINKIYLEWYKEGFFDTLIFSKDDCAVAGFNVDEAKFLEKNDAVVKTGADEIPLTLLAAAIDKNIKIYVEYLEPDCRHLVSNYEDVSIEQSVLGQITLAGFQLVKSIAESDIILYVNNFREKQGELVMGWYTDCCSGRFLPPDKPYAVADVRYANGSDNAFVEQLLQRLKQQYFYGYAGWNTSANTLGSLLACIKVRFQAQNFNDEAFKKLQTIRFLDDWAYQANVRKSIVEFSSIKELMSPFEKRLKQLSIMHQNFETTYIFPWNRSFEIEVLLDKK